jgi:hypothetical protein
VTQWIEHRWYGPAATVDAARAALPADTAVIGALIPPLGVSLRVLDGEAAISFLAREAVSLPAGLKDDKPQLLTALHGVLTADPVV